MSTLSDLESELSELKEKKAILEAKLKEKRTRRGEVIAVKASLNSVVGMHSSAVSIQGNYVNSNIDYAIKGSACASNVLQSDMNYTEKGIGSDANLNEADSALATEITNLNDEIDKLELDLSTTKSSIWSTEAAIVREKIRIAEEEARERAEEARREAERLVQAVGQAIKNAF